VAERVPVTSRGADHRCKGKAASRWQGPRRDLDAGLLPDMPVWRQSSIIEWLPFQLIPAHGGRPFQVVRYLFVSLAALDALTRTIPCAPALYTLLLCGLAETLKKRQCECAPCIPRRRAG
jgi:hypothetical protein